MSELQKQLMEGRADCADCDRIGAVSAAETRFPPYIVVDRAGAEVEPITQYLRDLALCDVSPLTCRSYGYDLLRCSGRCGCSRSSGAEQRGARSMFSSIG